MINKEIISDILYQELNKFLNKKKELPSIVDISIGNDYGSLLYSRIKKEIIEKFTKIKVKSVHFDDISLQKIKDYIISLNNDQSITGIMIQLPLPENLKQYEREILDLIDYRKDVDGLTSKEAGLLSVSADAIVPCTALGIESLLKIYNIDLNSKIVAIINRSNIVGKPLVNLMLKNNATPIICNSKTKDLKSITSICDIVIIATNNKLNINKDYLKRGTILIDAGIYKKGDSLNFANMIKISSLIPPSTNTVGFMTICMLAYNSAKCLYGSEVNDILKQGIKILNELINK